jgi:hypothetical protein
MRWHMRVKFVLRHCAREADGGDWVEVNRGTAIVPNDISEADLQVLRDDDMDEDE